MNINTLLLLAVQALASAATTVVTCQNVTTQYIENPYFEDGVTGWTVQYGTAGDDYDVYHSDDAPDGETGYVLALNGDHLTSNIISQEVSGLASGATYTFSMWWQLLSVGSGSCTAYLSFDNIDLGSQTLTSVSDDDVWKQFTATYDSSDDDGDLEILVDCTSGSFSEDSEVNFYNITFTGPSEVCSTATLTSTTLTPTPTATSLTSVSTSTLVTSSAVSSSEVILASSSLIPSSSAIISLASSVVTSVAATISSKPATSSSAVRPFSSSTIFIASSSMPASSSAVPCRRPIRTRSSSVIASHPASRILSTTSSGSYSSTSSSPIHSSLPITTSTSSAIEHASVSTTLSTTQSGPTITSQFTTSTIVTTEIRTITSCAASVTDCPARDRSTSLIAETVTIGTTIFPVTATEIGTGVGRTVGTLTTPTAEASSQRMTTSTVFTPQIHTVTACPASVTNCPASEKTTYVTTETVEAYTTICPVTATETGASSLHTSVVLESGSHTDTLPTVQVYTIKATNVVGALTTYLTTAIIPLGAASSSITLSNVVPGVTSLPSTSGYNIITPQYSSPVSTGVASPTEAAGPVYTGGSFPLRVDIITFFLSLMIVWVL